MGQPRSFLSEKGRCRLTRPLSLLCLLASLTMLPLASASLQDKSPIWSLPLNLSQSEGRSTFPAIAATGTQGDLLVLWVEYTDDPQGEVLVQTRLGSTGTWSGTVNLSASERADQGAILYADAQGRVHVAWTSRATGYGTDLLYRRWEEGRWSPPKFLDHTAVYIPSPYSLHFVEDISDTLWLFLNLAPQVSYTRLKEGVWEPLAPWGYVPGMKGVGAIALGPDGLFHVAARGENEGNLSPCDHYLDDAYYTTTDGSSWAPLLNLSSAGSIAYDMDLVYDPDGALHFLWNDISPFCSLDSEKSAVYERVLVDGSWGARTEVTVPNEGQVVPDLALQMNAVGALHLAWSEGLFNESGQATDLGIYYRRWMNGWGEEEVVWSSTEDSLNLSLALRGGIVPALVWEEGPSSAEEVTFSQRGQLYQAFLPLLSR